MTYYSVRQRRKFTSENWTCVSYFDFDSDNLSFKGHAIFEDEQQATTTYCEKYKRRFIVGENKNQNNHGNNNPRVEVSLY